MTPQPLAAPPAFDLEVWFDGACPLCARNRLRLTGRCAAEGCELHARR